MAAATALIAGSGSRPSFLTSRLVDTARTWVASATDFFLSPMEASGSIGTAHGLFSNFRFHSVIGTTIRIGSVARASELAITAGRVFRIFEPTVGSRFTSQISPRFIRGQLFCVEGLPLGYFLVRVVLVGEGLGRTGESSTLLFQTQSRNAQRLVPGLFARA